MAVLTQLFTGISFGAVLLLVALGLVLTFGQMNVINMAHGELIMAGAYTVYMLQKVVTSAGASLLVALPVAFVVSGLLGLAMEMLLLRRLYHRPLDTLLVTWGLSLVLQQAARDLFGAPNKQTAAPEWLTGAVEVGALTLPASRLFILAVAVVAVGGLSVALTATSLGRRIRAVVQNRNLAATSGIPTARVDRTTFFIGSGLAGVAGVALTLLGAIGPSMGTSYIVDAFLVVVAGGVGRIQGAVVMAFVIGMLNALLEYQVGASVAKVLVFVAVVLFIQWRPQGLFTLRTRSLA
ncbi:urea ABC transporter permease subunit UrtB [Kineosporia sp. R_H_3]|uniref:urea ABC transporter permease subunit UrtB n=1 Tax=Kineosporia sp. R_H_3 TaxID=1961848 RepID=UPI000B4B74EA|nr:urea ABC transporter permease subunit UrtB [Kineosporia sp. R_H_3]